MNRLPFRAAPLAALALGLSMARPARAQDEPQAYIVVPDVTREMELVRRVVATPSVRTALAYVHGSREETINEWLSLCNAYGPTGDEIYRARLIHKLLRIYGLENVHIDDQRNVIGIRRGTGGGPTTVLFSHHDATAQYPKEQPIQAFVADGRIWCPGAGDNLMGVTQNLAILRAMNAGEVKTKGDVWFLFTTGEEPLTDNASRGMEQFVISNYPHMIDWKKGDILMQLHGGAGVGVSTGSVQVRHRPQLRIFVPVGTSEWERHTVDALGAIIARISKEVRDERTFRGGRQEAGAARELFFFNMAMVQAGNTINMSPTEASIRFNMHATTEARIWEAHRAIMQIAQEECAKAGCTWHYSINSKNGWEDGVPGFDRVNNAPARMAVAASNVLYGTSGIIDWGSGCGDCVRAYRTGFPALSLRGNVRDYGDGRPITEGGSAPESRVRLETTNHDVTTSGVIDGVWAGIKHGLVFAVAYSGLVGN